MKLGILNGIGGKVLSIDMDRIRAAESMGYDSVWTAEAYGADAVTPAAWILSQTEKINVGTAIMQMPGRTSAKERDPTGRGCDRWVSGAVKQ